MRGKVLFMAVLLYVCFFSACKQRRNTSQIKHEFSQTSRPKIAEDCTLNDTKDLETTKHYFLVKDYLSNILAFIVQHENNREVFSGSYDMSNLCIRVRADWENNASGNANGRITFWLGKLLQAQSDTEVAATFSHELAHITLQHSEFRIEPHQNYQLSMQEYQAHIAEVENYIETNVKEVLSKEVAPDVQNICESILIRLRPLSRVLDDHSFVEDFISCTGEISPKGDEQKFPKLKNMLAKGSELQSSWISKLNAYKNLISLQEQEADEVGYEIFLRAGFNPEAYMARYLDPDRTSLSRTELEDCLRNIQFEKLPDRGLDTHPSDCYRVYNIQVNENRMHLEDYERFRNNVLQGNFTSSPTFSEVVEFIQSQKQ